VSHAAGAGAQGSSVQGATATLGHITGGDNQSEAAISPRCPNLLLFKSLAQSSLIRLYCSSACRFGPALRTPVWVGPESGTPVQILGCVHRPHTQQAQPHISQEQLELVKNQKGNTPVFFSNSIIVNCETVLPGLFKPQEIRTAGRGSAPQRSIPGTPLSPQEQICPCYGQKLLTLWCKAHDLAPTLHFLSKLYLEFMKLWWWFFFPLFCFRSGWEFIWAFRDF